jgi:predicted RNase H-like nuclease (RuvC/YqgF family)
MKEEREKEASRLAAQQSPIPQAQVVNTLARKEQNAKMKEERRKVAQLQELENSITELEAKLANLSAQLESPFVKPAEAAKLGMEYERVQKEMDEKLVDWERMQG